MKESDTRSPMFIPGDEKDHELEELKMQLKKGEAEQPVTIEDIQEGKGIMNDTQSESNATLTINHLTTNLSESSGFGEGPELQ